MAPSNQTMALALLFSLSLALPSALSSEVICEELKEERCAFAVSSESKRCVLEKGGQCKTSDVVALAPNMANKMETEACMGACGLHHNTIGMPSDSLKDPSFVKTLCSPGCFQNCPNIVDFYSHVSSSCGKGPSLLDVCKKEGLNPHREMEEAQPGLVDKEPEGEPSPSP